MLKRHLIVSAVCFLGFAAAEAPHLSAAETFVLLSVLLFVPAVFPFAFRSSKTLENVLLRSYPIAALSAALALITDFSFFAVVWFIYTLGLALYAVLRLVKTNIHRTEEMSVMAGFVYLAGGGVWFFAYVLQIPVMDFSPLIVLLTAVHFHYSAFLIPNTGLLDQMRELHSEDFSAEKLSPAVISFYEKTIDYDIKAKVTWSRWFRPFARMYEPFSRRAGQIHLSMNPDWYIMHSDMKGVDSDRDGRKHVRAWIRTNERQETVFTTLYSVYRSNGEGYINISLPLPYSQMTGILKPYAHKQNLVLTSRRRKSGAGDEGIYLQTKWWACHLPLAETFLIAAQNETTLKAVHHMWLFGLKFLTVHYRITHAP
ncbi:YndJ family transporter [Bacillus amyloliquefaciens]|uniref:YndJ family transporter n=1 Tax=Bacillus amyloliquefaciens TaxID=1390 RepID=UPI0025A0836D|nr:YndJ family transporter [Bacillus amyloliquefaciens]WJM56376.1 YndJ family transporter [Bacillus amyloliquefaciens]